jgi:hypothetical protein
MRTRLLLLLVASTALTNCSRWNGPMPGVSLGAPQSDPVFGGGDGPASSAPAPASASAVAAAPPPAAPTKDGKPGPLAPPNVRMWLAAPTLNGLWTVRIDNDEPHAVRIPADVRLVHLEIDEPDGPRKKTYKCELSAGLKLAAFPDRRSLLLAPGESYAESFDPHLFCFGKNGEALKGGNVVHATFGWHGKGGKLGPYAVESTEDPPSFLAVRELEAPTGILSVDGEPGAMWTQTAWVAPNAPPPPHAPPLPTTTPPIEHNVDHYTAGREARIAAAAKNRRRWDQPINVIYHTDPPKPKQTLTPDEPRRAPIVDENAPRLELTIDKFVDATAPDHVTLNVKATNVGKRPMMVVLRPRMLGLDIEGPDGDRHCEEQSSTGAVARDAFHTMRPGDSASFRFLVGEICSLDVFSRPGLYKIIAHLDANESGSEIGLTAYTGYATSELGFIRLSGGTDPFYATLPRPILREKLSDWE